MSGDHRPLSDTASPLADQAVDWLLRLRSDRITDADRVAFQHWHEQDIRHRIAWQRLTAGLSQTMGRLDGLTPASATRSTHDATGVRENRRRFLSQTMGLAACAGAGLFVTNVHYPLENMWTDYASATAERKHIKLTDGSDLLLDARTRLNLAFNERSRDLHLLAGAVSLRVAPDAARPLTIHTAQGQARALGTRFMVRQEVGRTLVVVQEHEIEVTCLSGQILRLAEGTGARFDQKRIDPARADIQHETAWQTGVIQVESRPLVQVIAALRPYYTGSLRVSAAAGGISVTGRYALDHVKGTLALLQSQLPISVREFTPWLTVIDLA